MSYVEPLNWYGRNEFAGYDAEHAWGYVVELLGRYGATFDSFDFCACIDNNTYAYRVKGGARELLIVAKIDHDCDFDEGNHRDLSRCVSLTMEERRV